MADNAELRMSKRGPRPTSLAADIRDQLDSLPEGADIDSLVAALRDVRRAPVLRHSVRSAIYQNLDGRGHDLFVRVGRGRYSARG
jgi:hypothetical protein